MVIILKQVGFMENDIQIIQINKLYRSSIESLDQGEFDLAKDSALNYISMYYGIMMTLKKCGENDNCFKCIEKQLNAAFRSFERMLRMNNSSVHMKMTINRYLLSIKRQLEKFYKEQGMYFEIMKLRKEFRENNFSIIHN